MGSSFLLFLYIVVFYSSTRQLYWKKEIYKKILLYFKKPWHTELMISWNRSLLKDFAVGFNVAVGFDVFFSRGRTLSSKIYLQREQTWRRTCKVKWCTLCSFSRRRTRCRCKALQQDNNKLIKYQTKSKGNKLSITYGFRWRWTGYQDDLHPSQRERVGLNGSGVYHRNGNRKKEDNHLI